MEKGGKGGKSSLKPSLGGKDDGSTKSKRGRRVQFDTEGSPKGEFNLFSKSDGKFETTFAKGGLAKGGKGDKVTNGGKLSLAKEALPLELRIEQELPKNARCLMDAEAAYILEGIQDQMALLSADPAIKIPISFDRGLQYAKSSSQYTDSQAVRKVLDPLKEHGVTDGEICVIANICPDTFEEIFALVPSLKDKRSILHGPLKDVLIELSKFKKSK